MLSDDGILISLIKPQFEAGKDKVGKKGVVRDPLVHQEVIEKTVEVMKANGLSVLGLDFSPVKGPEGNIEYLIYVQKSDEVFVLEDIDIQKIAKASHAELDHN